MDRQEIHVSLVYFLPANPGRGAIKVRAGLASYPVLYYVHAYIKP